MRINGKISNVAWLIMLLALFMRLPYLQESFWLDEAAQAIESSRPLSEQLNISYDFQPPLLHILTQLALYFGSSEWWLRMVGALIPGLLTIYFTIKIGTKIASSQAGLIAGLFLATNPFHIFYSQELRPYALAGMFGTVSWWFLLQWLDSEKKEESNSNQIVYIVLSLLGLYSTYLYPFLLLSQCMWVFFTARQKIIHFGMSLTTILVGFLPIIPLFFSQLSVGTALRSQLPGWENVVSLSQLSSIPLTLGKFLFGLIDLELSVPFILPVLLLLSGLTFLLITQFSSTSKLKNKSTMLLLFWILIPLLTSWLVSFWVPVIQPKRLLFLLPAWLLLAAQVAYPVYKRYQGVLVPTSPFKEETVKQTNFIAAWFVIAVIIGTQLTGLFNHFTNPSVRRENWREAYQTITATYPAETSVVLFSFTEPFAPWTWYDTLQYPAISTGTYNIEHISDLDSRIKEVTEYEHVLVFDYLMDLTDPNRRIEKTLNSLGYKERTTLDFDQIGFIRVYTRDSAVLGSRQ
ncbi:MAG: glycosyltransferase family 39 protein [Microgenomates group bacterium]